MLLNYVKHFRNPEKFEFHIITQDINDINCIRQFKKYGFKVHIVTHKRKSILKNVVEIYSILKKEKFEIAHSHMTLTNFYVLFLAELTGTKVRISHAHSAFKTDGIKKKIIYPILKILNCISANVWMTCGYNAGVFLYGKTAMDSGKVQIMNNGIELNHFQYNENTRKKIREKYQIGNAICIGHIGRFMAVKNHKFLISIFMEILKKKPDAKLLLVGDGELKEEIEELVQVYRIEKNVIFTGNVNNTNEFYQALDVFVLPSIYEGLPVVAIEAQAAGVPCLLSTDIDRTCAVTSNVHFMSVKQNKEKWANQILDMLKEDRDKSCIKELEKAGYSIELEARKLEDFYRDRSLLRK